MAAATWPGTLPQVVSWQGLARRIVDTRIRSNMDAGPAKLRSRYRANVFDQDLPVVFFTKAQWVLLEEFYTTTLQQGTLPFEWTEPFSGATVEFRFKTPPAMGAMLGPDTIPVTLNVEVTP